MTQQLWLVMLLSLAGCASAIPPRAYAPPVENTDYEALETCLYKTECKFIRARGSDPVVLDGIAVAATKICTIPLYNKQIARATYVGGRASQVAAFDRQEIGTLEIERHAMSIAMQQVKDCSIAEPKP